MNATILGRQLFLVERVNSSGKLKEFFSVPLGNYVVSVFDWEEDGSRAEVAVRHHLREYGAGTTTTTTTTTSAATTHTAASTGDAMHVGHILHVLCFPICYRSDHLLARGFRQEG